MEEKKIKNKYYAGKRLNKTAYYKADDQAQIATHPMSKIL